ncbi:MAG: dihydrofolate reductase family protein [Corynebacterium casei]|uniref:RibD domain-containing protein n=1 Tax=Corynebacterium casei UCMA 3821 TaxID=1110505 RepID=G7HVR4_9CORY|nr:dihydrofolate reductase family protein [Corynebacterium casei]CCE54279.1 RibD domain-containing protein [Corynebacterium casei UCMA 3821]
MNNTSAITITEASVSTIAQLAGEPAPLGKSHVRLIEISTLSGSAAIAGKSNGLGNEVDLKLLHELRAQSDVIVVGSKTVTSEKYVGIRPSSARPNPAPFAVITSGFSIDPASAFVKEAATPPLILAGSTAINDSSMSEKKKALQDAGVTIVDCGQGTATEIVQALNGLGCYRITCEGGPGVYGLFIASAEVDQLYLTLAPGLSSSVETALVSNKIVSSINLNEQAYLPMELEHLGFHSDSLVFLRYKNPARN